MISRFICLIIAADYHVYFWLKSYLNNQLLTFTAPCFIAELATYFLFKSSKILLHAACP